jgi:O-antigen/teichoic acid export membrane protein
MPAFFLSAPGIIATLGIAGLVAQAVADRRAGGVGRFGKSASPTARVMQVGLSLVVVSAALYVILFKPEAPEDHKWAYGAVALVLGFWLRPRRSFPPNA